MSVSIQYVLFAACYDLLAICVLTVSVSGAWGLPVPGGQNVYPAYYASPLPVVTSNPSTSCPIGTGGIEAGGDTVSPAVGSEAFDTPVDAYLGVFISAGGGSFLLLFTEGGGIQSAAQGIIPWKVSQTDISGPVFSGLPASALPMGTYTFFLIVVPENTPVTGLTENFYLWTASMDVYRGAATGQEAVALLVCRPINR